jgi:hypothetical protein
MKKNAKYMAAILTAISMANGAVADVNPAFGLGIASSCTVLELGAKQVSLTGPAGGIWGDVFIASGGKASWSGGGEYVNGDVYLGTNATYQNSGVPVSGGVFPNQNLGPEIYEAYAGYAYCLSLPATQTYTGGPTITGGPGMNVVEVPRDLHPNGNTVTIKGPSGAQFIIRVRGLLKLDGGGQIRVAGGILPGDVIYVVVGTGQDVGATGGGGGANCCKAIYDGTILAPYRKIALSPGLVNGAIISGADISMSSGSAVHMPNSTVSTFPTTDCVSVVIPPQGGPISPVTMVGRGGSGGPYSFTAIGLPAGLTISSTGTISGTPVVGGTFSYTITVTDSAGHSGSINCSIVIPE